MVKHTSNDDVVIREIDYSILIKDKDKEFHALRDILHSELTRFEDTRKAKEKAENPIREFLKINIERSIVIRDSTRVYFLEYREQGSLTIQFKLLVITRYVNYGSARQALDYLIKDTIGDYFEELIERHLPVNVSVHSSDTELYDIPWQQQETVHPRKQDSWRDFISILLASFSILLTLSLGMILLFQKNHVQENVKPTDDYRDKYFELLIEKQVKEAFEKEKLNIVLYKNLIAADSTLIVKPKIRKY